MTNSLPALRGFVARALVRWASRGWQASYQARERGIGPRYEAFWRELALRIDRFAIPRASRLDREAAGRQMVEECWWG